MLQSEPEIKINSRIADLIPVVCHYDEMTLLTKNHDLIQTIAINGFEHYDENFNKIPLRDVIRVALEECIKSAKIAVYIHSMNTIHDLVPDGNFATELAATVHQKWCESNQWNNQLLTTLYITFVIQGNKNSSLNFSKLHEAIFANIYKKKQLKELEDNCATLTQVTSDMTKATARFSSRILKIVQKSDKYHSEPMAFLYHLTHFEPAKILPITECNIAAQLADFELNYEFNSLIIRNLNNTADFKKVAVFSLKGFHELDVKDCAKILEHQYHYIISESIIFVPKAMAVKDFQRTSEFLEAGKSTELHDWIGMNRILEGAPHSPTAYCQRQLTITLYDTDEAKLLASTEQILKTFSSVGVSLIREDFFMPLAFWSSIPGNSQYINRSKYNLTEFSATFAFVPNSNMGSYNGSSWGPPVTIFKTANKLPYYFNFHVQQLGNTIIIGPVGSGKDTLLRFLLIQSTKLKPNMIFIDVEGNKEHFITSLNGSTIYITNDNSSSLTFNIFNLAHFNNDIEAFKMMVLYIIFGDNCTQEERDSIGKLTEAVQQGHAIDDIIQAIHNIPLSLNNSTLQLEVDLMIDQFIRPLASADQLEALQPHGIINLDFSKLPDTRWRNAFVRLLLAYLPKCLTGQPTIITVNNYYTLMGHKSLSTGSADLMKQINQRNAIMVFLTEYNQHMSKDPVFLNEMSDHIVTQIFLSDKDADKTMKKTFAMSDDELYSVRVYDHGRRLMLLRQLGQSVQITFHIESLKSVLGA